jgi:hypothetical protein
MRRRSWFDLLRSAVLVAVLVIVQTAVLTHLDTDDAHPAGTGDCVLCAGLSTLGAANVAGPATILPPGADEPAPDYQPGQPAAAQPRAPVARGPPRNT